MKPFILFNKNILSNISTITVNRIFLHDLDNTLFSYIHNYLLNHFDFYDLRLTYDKIILKI